MKYYRKKRDHDLLITEDKYRTLSFSNQLDYEPVPHTYTTDEDNDIIDDVIDIAGAALTLGSMFDDTSSSSSFDSDSSSSFDGFGGGDTGGGGAGGDW